MINSFNLFKSQMKDIRLFYDYWQKGNKIKHPKRLQYWKLAKAIDTFVLFDCLCARHEGNEQNKEKTVRETLT